MKRQHGKNNHSNRIGLFSFVLLILILVAAAIWKIDDNKKNSFTSNPSKAIEKADYFWKNDAYEKAISQMRIYLDGSGKSDSDAWFILASYYEALGNEAGVTECHKHIAMLLPGEVSSEDKIVLSAVRPGVMIKNDINNYT